MAAAIGLLRTAAARTSLLRAGARMFASDRMQPWQAPSFTQSGTRKLFTEEHDQYREVAKRFFAEKVTPFHEKWEDAGIVSREVWQEAGKTGLVGVTVPEAYGGPGADILYAAVLWDEQAFSGMFGPGFSIHSEICLPYIMHYGSEAIKQKYLPKTVTGDCIVAIAMTEPGAGSDLQGIKTTAVREGDEYVINGSKTFISNGALSDTCIVVARTDPQASKAAHGISLIMVDTNTPGYTKGRKLKKLGLKAQDTSELFFDNVRVPVTNRLGEENKGFYYLMNELPQERLTIAGLAIAHAEACYEWTRTYVKERKAFGGTLSNLQTVRHKLAELKTMISVSRAFFDNCLELHVNGKLDTQTASMAKYWCTDVECKVADECLQLHGGWGYMWEFPISRAFADARVQKIYGGANEIMKELISRSI